MEKEFVPYELAVKLKVLGFNEPCFGRWWFRADMHKLKGVLEIIRSNYFELPEHCILAPTFSQAFRWFREKNYYIAINIYPTTLISSEFFTIEIEYINEKGMIEWIDDFTSNTQFDTYEEAENACLTKLIEIVESKPNC